MNVDDLDIALALAVSLGLALVVVLAVVVAVALAVAVAVVVDRCGRSFSVKVQIDDVPFLAAAIRTFKNRHQCKCGRSRAISSPLGTARTSAASAKESMAAAGKWHTMRQVSTLLQKMAIAKTIKEQLAIVATAATAL